MTTDRDYASKDWLAELQAEEDAREAESWRIVMMGIVGLVGILALAILLLHLGAA